MIEVSVIMGVFNGEKFIRQALQSIVNQTYKNFELIICDDGSTDSTRHILNDFNFGNTKVIIESNDKNRGLGYSLNKCIELSSGKYLVRMDADDISVPNRLERLVDLMKSYPDFAVIGSGMILFDNSGEWGSTVPIENPTPEQVFKGPAVSHATTILNKDAVTSVGMYNIKTDKYRIEDYDLWCRLTERKFKIMSTNELLYKCRWDSEDYYKRRKVRHLLGYVKYKFYWNRRLGFGVNGYLHIIVVLVKALTPNFVKKRYHRYKLSQS